MAGERNNSWRRRATTALLPLLLLGCGQARDGATPAADAAVEAPATGDSGPTNGDGGASATSDAAPTPRLERPRRGTDGMQWSDPSAVAREALTRLRDENLADVLVIATEVNQSHRLPRVEGRSAAQRLFGETSWRARAVTGWDGNLGETRVLGDEAWVAFADLPEERVAVVLLHRRDSRWRLQDLRNPSRARFGRFGEVAE